MIIRRSVSGFTLIELLTVVAIISLLISILTPSLSRARDQSKATACGARLHDMATALNVYANDHGGSLPPAEFYTKEPNCKFGWCEVLAEQLYRQKPPAEPNGYFPVQNNYQGVGGNYFYYFNCPGLGKEENHTGHYRVYLPAWCYGSFQRDAQGRIDPNHAGDPTKPAGLDAVPPQLPILGDAKRGVKGEPTSYVYGGEAAPGADGRATFDDRHYGRANMLYHDGHVELTPYLDNDRNLFIRLNYDWDLDGVADANSP